MTLQIENAILEVYPYWHKDTWVFDDARVGLVEEPFIAGVPEMINLMVKDIPNAEEGFKMTFSKFPFPSFSQEIRKTAEEGGGNWYQMVEAPYLEGWLCPALFKYFNEAPDSLYVKADKVIQDKPWWRIW